MHLGSLESTQEARVALGCASSNSYASFVLSKLPACNHNSIYACTLSMNQFLINTCRSFGRDFALSLILGFWCLLNSKCSVLWPLIPTHVLTEIFVARVINRLSSYSKLKAVRNTRRVITTAVTEISFKRHQTLKILCSTICLTIHDVPTEPLTFQKWRRRVVLCGGFW